MTDLNENHQRILFHRLAAIDHALFELECTLDPISRHSPFRNHVAGLTKAKYEVVEAFCRRLRTRLLEILSQKSAMIPPETVGVHRAIRPHLLAIGISIEELGPKHMQGYGSLSAQARGELQEIVNDLQKIVAEFEEKLTQQQTMKSIQRQNSRKERKAMKAKIALLSAMEILDSRGNPTVRVFCKLDNGISASASVPSGASTGENEAVELRDGDHKRYGGKGVLKAVAHVNADLGPRLLGMDPFRQAEIDRLMIELDGTPTKSRFGANAILGVSMAVARAAALAAGLPLYSYLGGPGAARLPVPMMNILNGGKHADNSVDFQEYMVMPLGAPTFAEALRYGAETFHALKKILAQKGYTTSVGDEGGFAPNLKSNEEACDVIVEAITAAGYRPGQDIAIALDPAASSFFEGGHYNLSKSGQGQKTSAEMTALYEQWISRYPIVSIEDGLAENDWDGFKSHTAALGGKIQIVGDDIYVTNTQFIARGIQEATTNAVLIKLNQIGTVTETIEAIELCRRAGWNYVISHRSGETEDVFMADFAVAMGGGQIKTGSACRSERIAKYNRLLEVEKELGRSAVFSNPLQPF